MTQPGIFWHNLAQRARALSLFRSLCHSGLLTVDDKKRLTAHQAMNHPWLQSNIIEFNSSKGNRRSTLADGRTQTEVAISSVDLVTNMKVAFCITIPSAYIYN